MVDPLDPSAHVPENSDAVFAVQADLLDDAECERIIEVALARFGQVDLLVNAAASFHRETIIGSDRLGDHFDRDFHLNVRVPLILSAQLARHDWLAKRTENMAMNRNIVNVASIGGVRLYPGGGVSVYSASKAALAQLSRHMADEFWPFGVRVNVLAPSAFPRLIATERVSERLRELDEGLDNGRVVVLSKDGDSVE